jgi:predicted RNase H-like HicB family nuclease
MKKQDKYVFPAVFTYEEGYEIAVTFPDLPGCATSGADEPEALAMAKDALGGHLWFLEKDDDEIPAPTRLCDVKLEDNEQAALIDVYMPAVRLSQEARSVNRTVTLPAWLNAAALERGINFSQALQSTLMNELGISR